MARVTTDDLLAALIALRPNEPGPEWETLPELVAGAEKRGAKISKHSMQQRLNALVKAGTVERSRAPRRGNGTGWQFYYKFKNGKR